MASLRVPVCGHDLSVETRPGRRLVAKTACRLWPEKPVRVDVAAAMASKIAGLRKFSLAFATALGQHRSWSLSPKEADM